MQMWHIIAACIFVTKIKSEFYLVETKDEKKNKKNKTIHLETGSDYSEDNTYSNGKEVNHEVGAAWSENTIPTWNPEKPCSEAKCL